MDEAAYREYADEAADWLKTGRSRLLAHLVQSHRPDRAIELLEIGAGVGQNLPVLARFGDVDAIEVSPIGRAAILSSGVVRELFSGGVPMDLPRKYDVICALDVIEHIEDDGGAIAWIADHLRPGGIFVGTVPAYQWLFSAHDVALHHFRRYTRHALCSLIPSSMDVVTAGYYNHLLFPLAVTSRGTWSLKRRLLGGTSSKQRAPRNGPIATILDHILRAELALIAAGYEPRWGLSVYCCARLR